MRKALIGLVAGLLLSHGAAVYSLLEAQVVALRVVEESSHSPIVGAIVRLIGARGEVARGLTDGLGRITLRAQHAGRYSIRIDRIGASAVVIDAVDVSGGAPTQLTIPVTSQPMTLPPLAVVGTSPCRRSDQLDQISSVLWQEIQKALDAHLVSQVTQLLHRREFLREVSLDEKSMREWVVLSSLMRGPPFAALPPASLIRDGFVRLLVDSATFAAPDAALLMSDEFLSTHCLRTVTGSDGLIGLAFEPLPGRRVSDIAGTLWVERFTSELRHLEFTYTGLSGTLRRANLGGRVEFQRLPTGAWIVSYWHVRMPRFETTSVTLRREIREITRLTGYLDRGGRAEPATDSTGRVDRAVVRGVVFDSLTSRGLAGAVVSIPGAADSVVTNDRGWYELVVAASGDQEVFARHPRLELLGGPIVQPALLSLGDTTAVHFAAPSLQSHVQTLCRRRGESGLLGSVWRAEGYPAPNQEVQVIWAERDRSPQTRNTTTNDRGLWALCDLPSGLRLTIRAVRGRIVLTEEVTTLRPGEFHWQDLREWGSVDSSAAPVFRPEILDRTVEQNDSAVVIGTVTDVTTGEGLANATVGIQGRSDSARADADGSFRMVTDASGSWSFHVTHAEIRELGGATIIAATLSLGDTTHVRFEVAPVSAVIERQCGVGRSHTALAGRISTSEGRGNEGAELRVQWRTSGGSRTEYGVSGSNGVFVFRDLPAGIPLQVQMHGRLVHEVRLEPKEHRWITMGSPSPDRLH